MKYINAGLAFVVLLLLNSCYDNRIDITVPQSPDGGNFINETYPLSQGIKQELEGVYTVTAGSDMFGSTVIMMIAGDRMSIYTNKQVGYFVLRSGSLDSVVFFDGYWRRQTSTETGLARFYVAKGEGGKYLFGDTTGGKVIKIRGTYGNESADPSSPILLQYVRPLNPSGVAKHFTILAHHGFQTSDNMPASENSVEIIRILERYGATGVEVDVRLSKDRIPYLYHDEQLNPRLTQRTPLIGASEDYSMAALKTFVRLLHGEQIPTVREALEAVLNDTKLTTVWLDLKTTDVQIIKEVIPIQQDILRKAQAMGRTLEIFIGLPTDSHISEFMNIAGHDTIPSLCELELSDVRNVNARVWGPRWTRGLLLDEVDQMHAEGRRVFTWTVTAPEFIQEYLEQGRFDGMISDYPMSVNYILYAN